MRWSLFPAVRTAVLPVLFLCLCCASPGQQGPYAQAHPIFTPVQYPGRPTAPPMSHLPSGIPKMALQHLAKARKWQSDAFLAIIRVHNYFMVPGTIPQHGVYGVYLSYFSPRAQSYRVYAVGPNGEDVLLERMPPGALPANEVGMLPLHFVDLPEAFNALQASGVGGRVQMATFHFVAGDQPNMYPAWDIKTLGGRHVGPLYVLADSGKVVSLADLHPHATRGDPDIWLENLYASYMRNLAEMSQSESQAGPRRPSFRFPQVRSCSMGNGGTFESCTAGSTLTTYGTYHEAQERSHSED